MFPEKLNQILLYKWTTNSEGRVRQIYLVIVMLLFLISCEETTIYETDPRYFNDAFHGSIIGKVLQSESGALVIVSQVQPIDTAEINPLDGSFEIVDLPIGNYDLQIIADNFRIYKLMNVLVTGAGTTYIGEVELLTVPDLVSSYYPENKGEIVYNNRYSRLTISMSFTKPMDRKSVEEAFSTIPATEGIFRWETYSNYPAAIYFSANAYSDPDLGAQISTYTNINSFSYIISQKDSFVDTTYSIVLSTEAKDTAGTHLRFPLEYSFSTIQSSSTLNGIQTTPYHGDVDVDLLDNDGMMITFPRNMNKQSVENAISVSPSNGVIFLWPEANSLTVYTGGVYFADTTYYVLIDSTAKDLDGVLMGNPFSFSFSTAPVGLEYTNPRNGQVFVDLDDEIIMRFNTYMIKSSVQNAFTITPSISGSFVYDTYSSRDRIDFVHSQNFQKNTKYTVTISTEAVDLHGSHLKEAYEFSFVTRPE